MCLHVCVPVDSSHLRHLRLQREEDRVAGSPPGGQELRRNRCSNSRL